MDPNEIKVIRFTSRATDLVNEARSLLHQVYVEEQGWMPSPGNPSGLKIVESTDGRRILADDYDDLALWCGGLYQGKLVICGRACGRDEAGRFEVQRYPSGRRLDELLSINKHPDLLELTRAAIHPGFRNAGAFIVLLHETLKYLRALRTSAFTLCGDEKPMKLYRAIGFPEIKGVKFKYEDRDAREVKLFMARAQGGELAAVIDNLEERRRTATPLAQETPGL